MLCYRCGSHVADGTESCGACGQKFALGLKPGPIAGFGTGTRRHRVAVESSPYNVGDVLSGRFEVREQAGGGPIGWVYKCVDRDMDLDVAVKVISPRLFQTDAERRRLSTHLRGLRALVHDNIVRIYEDGEDGGRVFFTMQYVEALSLRRIWDLRRQKGQAFTLAEVIELVKQIAGAVDAAHDKGLGHGALKPDNVLVLPDLVKVSDFGLAQALPRASFIAAQKSAGVSRYLAPELRQGEAIAARADVFSLGVIVGEMLGGAPYEPGREVDDPTASLPDGVNDIFLRAIAQKPEDRFATAGAFAQALADTLPRPASALAAPAKASAPRPPPPVSADDRDLTDEYEFEDVEEITDADVLTPVPPPPPKSPAPPPPAKASPPAPRATAPKPTESKPRASSARASAVASGEPAWTAPSERSRPPVAPVALRPEPPASKAPMLVAGLLVAIIAGVFFYLAWGAEGRRIAELGSGEILPAVVPEAVVDAGAEAQAIAENEPEADVAEEPVAVADLEPAKPEPESESEPVAAPEKPVAKAAAPVVESPSKEERRAAARAEIIRKAEERDEKRRRDEAVARLQEMEKEAEAARQRESFERAAKAVVSVKPKTPAAEPKPEPEAVAAKEPTCTPGMRLIPAGSFRFGAPDSDDLKNFSDVDQATVTTEAYCIDLYEYPNRKGNRPGTNVKFSQAVASCKSRGKRLCTEPEWERACKGPTNARFPYGNAFNASACNTEDSAGQVRQVSDTGSFAQCASGYGVFDLAGNVAEWVDTPFDSGANRTVKGGAANRPDFATRCAARVGKSPEAKDALIGFRCCADPA